MKYLKREQGFSLIELMVVISVITILIAIGMPRFVDAKRLNNTSKLAADLRSIDSAIAMYEVANGVSPKIGALQDSGLYPNDPNAAKYFASLPTPPSGDIYYSNTPGGVAISRDKFNTNTPKQNYVIAIPTATSVPTGMAKVRGTVDLSGTRFSCEYFCYFQK